MAINKILFIGLAFIISQSFQCNKRLDCARTIYSFSLNVIAYPNKDSIHIGDTIWVEIDEPTTLKDAFTGSMVDYRGAANLGSAISFDKYSMSSGLFTIDAAQEFNFSVVSGRQINSTNANLYHEFRFSETNGHYRFKLGIIPKETGVFRFLLSSAANVYRKGDRCTKASFAMFFKSIDQHYYLNPNFPGGPVAPGGDYYFKVY